MKKKIINLLGIRKKGTILCHFDIGASRTNVIMEPITDKQEERIEKSKLYYGSIKFVKNKDIVVPAKDIYLYGDVDVNSEEDIKYINKFNLISDLGDWIYSNFDYETGNVTSDEGIFKGCTTFNALKRFKLCHCIIGKPKKIIVYKLDNKFLKKIWFNNFV